MGVWHPVQGGKRDAEEGKEGEENRRFRAWAIGVVKTLGGTEWKRSGVAGAILNVGIPVSAVDDLPEGVADEIVDAAEKDYEVRTCPCKAKTIADGILWLHLLMVAITLTHTSSSCLSIQTAHLLF